ncbi:hypothetical protein [Amycolatopsis sp. NPDC059021]|uniref:hypothetical protein n=1 Tax=Amycolatopsis sp. NPDC059021 TaxID=3346704 RepID=UPI00366CE202
MTGPYGYPAPQPGLPYGAPVSRPTGATAVLAALLGLLAAVAAGYVPVTRFIDLPSGLSLGDLPPMVLAGLACYLVAGLLLLVGALSTLFRATAGAVLLLLGALLAIAAILLEPVAVSTYAKYFTAVFRLRNFAAYDRVALMALAPLTLLFAVLPPTFKYLRHRPQTMLPPYGQGPQGYSPPRQW